MLKFVFLSLDTFPSDAIKRSPTGSLEVFVLGVASGELLEQGASS
jgi:hypothetical protein